MSTSILYSIVISIVVTFFIILLLRPSTLKKEKYKNAITFTSFLAVLITILFAFSSTYQNLKLEQHIEQLNHSNDQSLDSLNNVAKELDSLNREMELQLISDKNKKINEIESKINFLTIEENKVNKEIKILETRIKSQKNNIFTSSKTREFELNLKRLTSKNKSLKSQISKERKSLLTIKGE